MAEEPIGDAVLKTDSKTIEYMRHCAKVVNSHIRIGLYKEKIYADVSAAGEVSLIKEIQVQADKLDIL
jgi:hypothetical protein